jgi:hypothetical protein
MQAIAQTQLDTHPSFFKMFFDTYAHLKFPSAMQEKVISPADVE